MNEEYHSCFVSCLSRFVTRTDQECAFIQNLENDEQPRQKNHSIVSLGDSTDGIMILKSGWAMVKADSFDGQS